MLKGKKWTPLALGLAGIALALYYLAKGTPEKPVAQPIAEPSNVPFESYIGGAGLTEPNSENIAIGSHIPGIVRYIAVQVGDKVKKEDPLFIIEDREAVVQVSRSEALVKQRDAEWENGKEQLSMSAKLKDAGAISNDERNQRALALEVAKALLDAAKAELQTSRTRLSLHTVRAPIDGVVMAMNLRVGEFAPAGQTSTALLQLGNLNPLHVRVDIDENDAWRFLPDRKGIAFLRGNPAISVKLEFVRLEPFVRPKKSLTGESTERVDTRVLQIIYRFDPAGKPIYAGQQLDIYIEAEPLPKVAKPAP
ncbi:MAG: efflux RND transporter periplasmic adaptor subunit [Lacunisphaera sp.]|nr:efflux RND transporter periplasmic adaptor subunit [Lacunisphaera sp.]